MEKDGDTKRKILKTAEMLIGNESVCSITTRRIAEEADVNPAALNYHFGSKKELIDLALSQMMDSMFNDWLRILEIRDMALPVRLYCMIDHTMESIIKYPGMLSSHLFDPTVSIDKRVAFAGRMGEFLRSLPVQLEEELPLQAEEIRLNLGQVILSAISAAAVPELFREIAEEDISSDPARSRFITGLMKRFLRIEIKASEIIQSDIARVRKLAFDEREVGR